MPWKLTWCFPAADQIDCCFSFSHVITCPSYSFPPLVVNIFVCFITLVHSSLLFIYIYIYAFQLDVCFDRVNLQLGLFLLLPQVCDNTWHTCRETLMPWYRLISQFRCFCLLHPQLTGWSKCDDCSACRHRFSYTAKSLKTPNDELVCDPITKVCFLKGGLTRRSEVCV